MITKADLANFNGTESYHRATVAPNMLVTDGAVFLAQGAQCFWLLDEIANAQMLPQIRDDESLQSMQFWTLKKGAFRLPPTPGTEEAANFDPDALQPTAAATLVCERDSNDVAYVKTIPFTDFPFDVLGEQRLWVAPLDATRKVIYLPSEH